MTGMDDRLNALWAEYRDACPDPESSTNFMPQLWQKIESRRVESVSVFRRMAQICVMATVALTLAITVLLPRIQRAPVYSATYIDVLENSHSIDAADLIASEMR